MIAAKLIGSEPVRSHLAGRAWREHRPAEVHIIGHVAAVQNKQWREYSTEDKAYDEPAPWMADEFSYVI